MSSVMSLLSAGLVLTAVAHAAPAAICDFEDATDRECNAMGFDWIGTVELGSGWGLPQPTTQVNHTPGGGYALYNNFNAAIAYQGIPVESLWIRHWARFAADSVSISGVGVISLSTTWQQVQIGGQTSFIITPAYNGTANFGTFAIDDVNAVPEPTSLALVGGASLAALRRRRR